MKNRFQGNCFMCGRDVPAGHGDFQSIGSLPLAERRKHYGSGQWLVRCHPCKGKGNITQLKIERKAPVDM